MAAFSKQKGLFGAPMMGAGAAQMTGAVSASPVAAALAPSTETKGWQAPKRTTLDKIGLLADALRGTNENAMLLRQQDQDSLAAWERGPGAQLAQAQEFAGFVAKEQYKAAHPGADDDAFSRTLRGAGIDPASPQGRALYAQRAQTLAAPAPTFVSDGAGGGRWVQPSLGGGAPQAPVGRLTPLSGGGATPGGSRTFPVR